MSPSQNTNLLFFLSTELKKHFPNVTISHQILPKAYQLIPTPSKATDTDLMAVILINNSTIPSPSHNIDSHPTPPFFHVSLPHLFDSIQHAKLYSYDPLLPLIKDLKAALSTNSHPSKLRF